MAHRLGPRGSRAWCVLAVCAALARRAPEAGAAPVAANQARPRPAEPALLALVLKSDSAQLAADPLAEALSRELGVAVLPLAVLGARRQTGVITVSWRPTHNELAVSFGEPGRGVVSRVVRAPADFQAVAELAITLAGNLARDQVADLLGTALPPPPVVRLKAAPPASTAPPASAAPPASSLAQPLASVAPPPPPTVLITSLEPVVQAPPAAPAARVDAPITLALFHPLATNGDRPDVATAFHLNLIYGRVGALRGFELGGWNAVHGPVRGAQVGMLGNAAETVAGVQLGLVANLTTAELSGAQVAFAFNRTGGDLHGVQATFGINDTGGAMDGLQLGSVNLATGPVRGAQIGLVNVARGRVNGAQLGLINVADDVDGGLPIGLVSVSRTGTVDPVLWFSTVTVANVGVKFANRNTYTILALAMAIENPSGSTNLVAVVKPVTGTGLGVRHFVGPGLAIGGRLPLRGAFTLTSDIGVGFLSSAPGCCTTLPELWREYEVVPRWRASVGLERRHGLSPFVGGGVGLKIHRDFGDTLSTDFAPDIFAGLAL